VTDKNQKEKQQEFQQKKEIIINQLKNEGFPNIANAIENSTAKQLADDNTIDAWKSAYPDLQDKLEAIKQKAKTFLDKDHYVATPDEYFERNSNGTYKFKPDKLASELEEEYNFKYVEDTEKFYVYQDKYWQDRAERLIKEEANQRLGQQFEPRYANNTVETLQTRPSVSCKKSEFRPADNKIPFKNCTYNIATDEKETHKPQDNFTHKIPWDLDRDAQCPRINEFLDEVTANEQDKELILETIGYSMLADMPYGHALILYGGGKNGKSVLLNLWKRLLNEENYKEEDLQQLENTRFATRWLYRKLALFSDDMPATKLEKGSTLKSLTGGGETRAEIKGGDHFEFKNYATPVFACNEIPESNDDSDGFYRRWEIVNFPYKFVENPVKDNHKKQQPKDELLNELTAEEEMKGLLNEALVRLEMVKENGGIYHKTDADSTRSLWRSYSNPTEQFIEHVIDQGMTQQDAAELDEDRQDVNLNEYGYDFIVKDDLVWLLQKYCEYYDKRPPTKTKITQKLKNNSPYYVQEGRTRQLGSDNDRTRVYKFIKFSDEFLDFVDEEKKRPDCPYFFENLRAHASRVYRSLKQSQDTRDTSVLNLGEKISEYLDQQSDEVVDEQELIEEIEADEEEIEDKIEQLKSDGELFRPQPGKIQKI
jgi:P4 family phage/plasmid primase-like protien